MGLLFFWIFWKCCFVLWDLIFWIIGFVIDSFWFVGFGFSQKNLRLKKLVQKLLEIALQRNVPIVTQILKDEFNVALQRSKNCSSLLICDENLNKQLCRFPENQ